MGKLTLKYEIKNYYFNNFFGFFTRVGNEAYFAVRPSKLSKNYGMPCYSYSKFF